MTVRAFVLPQFAKAAPLEPVNEDALAMASLPVANSSLLPDPAPAVLAETATDWFVLTLASKIHVSAEHGCIRMTGYVDNVSLLKSLKGALLRLSGVGDLGMTVTAETLANPPRTHPTAQHSQHVG